jgi:hypothetical protein
VIGSCCNSAPDGMLDGTFVMRAPVARLIQ